MIQVKESPVPSDTLLTVDLKSGSKIKIGTHTITLDKFFEGNLKTTRWPLPPCMVRAMKFTNYNYFLPLDHLELI